eukprot:CAMPEP_0176197796 /NCGR_PEP_ID=MMETSP0121_2-20121125/7725_1 /TAXON_ID=160619 /ORGANISM="Kryptoperidinium foliaceum, Strain CCMP 1326" /LENGTH=214 /DNA_ID=CAMNT_0017536633 /DNA_START=86 /DNA_END=730 /DNA_ORIENTATION=-
MADVEMARGALEENLNLTTDEELAAEAPTQHVSLRKAVLGGMVLLATAMAAVSLRGGLGRGGRPETAVLQQSSLLAAYAQDQGNGVPFPTWSYDAVPHGDQFHGAMPLPAAAYDPVAYHGDQYHGVAAPAPCKYVVGSHVYTQSARGEWQHAVVQEVRPGCSYQVELEQRGPTQLYSTVNAPSDNWWSANWWWVCFLALVALVAGLFIASAQKA